MRYLFHVPGDAVMSLMSGALGTHGHTSEVEPGGTWRRQSPPSLGDGSRAAGHVATPEPFLAGWRARCHGARGDTRVLPHREADLEPQDTSRH
jgi:hypothetical protein